MAPRQIYMFRFALLFAIVALAGGCIGSSPHLGSSYEVLLDPSLSAVQVETIMLAGEGWQAKATGLLLTYTLTACGAYSSNLLHTICFRSSDATPALDATTDIDGHTNCSPDDDRADITLYPNNIAKRPATYSTLYVIAHEYGHALSHREDHLAEGNLMAPAITSSESITSADVGYFWSQR